MVIKILILFSCFLTTKTFAKVNMLTGQFFHTLDLKLNKTFNFKITYKSNDTFSGYFGSSWCSELDQKMNISSRQLNYCGEVLSGVKVKFIKNRYLYKLNTKTYLFNNRGRLTHICVSKKCYKVKIKSNKNLLLVHGNTKIYFNLNQQGLVKLAKNNSNKIFSVNYKNKNLSQIFLKNGNIRFDYDRKKMSKLYNDRGQYLNIQYRNEKVYKVSNEQNCVDTYDYKKASQLSVVLQVKYFCKNKSERQENYLLSYYSNGQFKSIKQQQSQNSLIFNKKSKLQKEVRNRSQIEYDSLGRASQLVTPQKDKIHLLYSKSNLPIKIKQRSKGGHQLLTEIKYHKNQVREIRSRNKLYKFSYKNNKPYIIEASNGEILKYNYQGAEIASLDLKKNKMKYNFSMRKEDSKVDTIAIAEFYNDIYESFGKSIDYVPQLKELF